VTLCPTAARLGALVDVIAVYETIRETGDGRKLAAEILAGRIDVVTFTSSSTVRGFAELVAAGGGVRSVRRGGDRARDGGDGPELGSPLQSRLRTTRSPASWMRSCGTSRSTVTAFKWAPAAASFAMWQAEWVKRALAGAGVAAELVIIKTRGDAEVDRPLHELEGKGFFTKEIEDALRDGRIDVAVHCSRICRPASRGLVLPRTLQRADPAEALVTRETGVTSIAEFARGARLGTSSLRRVAGPYLAPTWTSAAAAATSRRGCRR